MTQFSEGPTPTLIRGGGGGGGGGGGLQLWAYIWNINLFFFFLYWRTHPPYQKKSLPSLQLTLNDQCSHHYRNQSVDQLTGFYMTGKLVKKEDFGKKRVNHQHHSQNSKQWIENITFVLLSSHILQIQVRYSSYSSVFTRRIYIILTIPFNQILLM